MQHESTPAALDGKKQENWILPLLLCVLVLPLCAMIIRPWVELGVIDDWSYIRSAQILAGTGKIVYNGWAGPMLGWQLYLGALFIKVLGFSFGHARLATLLVSSLTATLMQRLLVRLGVNPWNATAATLVFVISPVFLGVTFSFMSDIYGLFALILCVYCCVRALQATGDWNAAIWILVAALSNTAGGTARQIAWLGVLVLVPTTTFLLRANRKALGAGVVAIVLGASLVYLSLHWLYQQPFSVPESVVPSGIAPLGEGLRRGFQVVDGLFFLAMPLLVVFSPVIFRNERTIRAALVIVALWIVDLIFLYRAHRLYDIAVPYLFNNLWLWGAEYFQSFIGHPPLLLTPKIRAILTLLVLLGEAGLFSAFCCKTRTDDQDQVAGPLPLRTTLMLLLPCTVCYLLLLLPRLLTTSVIDRYLLFPEFTLIAIATRLYQQRISNQLPSAIWLVIFVVGSLDAVLMHDAFAQLRAQNDLLQGMVRSGIARTDIDGGLQFNGWTEITALGYVNEPHMRVPAHAYQAIPKFNVDDCHTIWLDYTPLVKAKYVVSFDPSACRGRSDIVPLTYSTWLRPHTRTLYVVKGPYSQ